MKKKIIVFGIMTIVLMIGTLFCRICYVHYQEKIKLTYIGSAVGECPYFEDENGLINPEKWKEKNMYIVVAKVIESSKKKIILKHLVKSAILNTTLSLLLEMDIVMYAHMVIHSKH